MQKINARVSLYYKCFNCICVITIMMMILMMILILIQQLDCRNLFRTSLGRPFPPYPMDNASTLLPKSISTTSLES